MGELLTSALEIARAVWRYRWYGICVAWIVALLGAGALMRLPDRFEANARVFVDTKTVLRPLMRDLAVEPDIEQTVGLLARTLITRPNVELLLRKSDLKPKSDAPAEHEALIESLMRNIKIINATNARDNVFTFTYRHEDPAQARLVVENLVAMFVESDRESKLRDSESARGFIDQQIKQHEARLVEAENRLKEFKLKNLGKLEGPGRDFFSRIAALTDDVQRMSVDLRAAEQSRDALKRELEGETATLVPDSPSEILAAQTPELDARLEGQRRTLDELLRRYTDVHPDVLAARRLIARLEEQKQQELEARKRALESRPKKTSSMTVNPVFQQIRVALATADSQVAAIRLRLGEAQEQLNHLRASANRVPQIEAELAQLNRDYDIVRRNYDALVTQREKASISEDVDATRGAQFRVIDPPRTLPNPVFPSRVALAPLLLVFSLLVGVAVGFLISQLRPTVDNARALREVTKRPVLGSVSMLVTDETLRRARFATVGFGSAFGGLIVCFGGLMAWLSVVTRA